MYDINRINPKDGFTYWFVRQLNTIEQGKYERFDVFFRGDDGDVYVGFAYCFESPDNFKWDEGINESDYEWDKISEEFELFRSNRPEYFIGKYIPTETINTSVDNANIYDKLITGAFLLQYDDEKGMKLAEKCLKWLRGTDFYDAPGSIKFHDSEPEGLLKHSLRVVNHIINLLNLPMFRTIEPVEVIVTALVHDWCKVGMYKPYMRNVKDDETGKWERVAAFRRGESPIPFGHAVSSMYAAQKFFKLTLDQCLAIRWHMGAWNVSPNEECDLSHSNATYPMVLLLQWADQASITDYGADLYESP
jgi:hypothetical protein